MKESGVKIKSPSMLLVFMVIQLAGHDVGVEAGGGVGFCVRGDVDVGGFEGLAVGVVLGSCVGFSVGADVGFFVGLAVGLVVGGVGGFVVGSR